MPKVLCSDGKTIKAFDNQEYFQNFVWRNWAIGDIVWLEDMDEVNTGCGIFVGYVFDRPTIRLLSVPHYEIVNRNSSLSIMGYPDHWKDLYLKNQW